MKVDCNMDELPILYMRHFPFIGYSAMMWCCYIIKRDDNRPIGYNIIKHETVHYKQICTYGSNLKYYLRYIWEWIKCGMVGVSAYYLNPFEVEAYVNEETLDYKTYKGKWKKYKIPNGRKLYRKNKYNWKQFLDEYFKDVH